MCAGRQVGREWVGTVGKVGKVRQGKVGWGGWLFGWVGGWLAKGQMCLCERVCRQGMLARLFRPARIKQNP